MQGRRWVPVLQPMESNTLLVAERRFQCRSPLWSQWCSLVPEEQTAAGSPACSLSDEGCRGTRVAAAHCSFEAFAGPEVLLFVGLHCSLGAFLCSCSALLAGRSRCGEDCRGTGIAGAYCSFEAFAGPEVTALQFRGFSVQLLCSSCRQIQMWRRLQRHRNRRCTLQF